MPGDKTEKPTPRRQKKAREQGQIARSRDVSGALALLAAVLAIAWAAKQFPGEWRRFMSRTLAESATSAMESAPLLNWTGAVLAGVIGPALAFAWLAAAAAAISQGGLVFAPAALTPNFSRLNPATRIKQLFSLPALSRLLRLLVPACVIVYLAAAIVIRDWNLLTQSRRLGPGGLAHSALAGAFELTWKSALVLLAWSAFDYMLERQHLASELRMTRQELMDDYKESEGHPAIKARIRRLRRQLFRRRMLEDAKRASVVITNPTEFAIALEYKSAMSAPMVVAKGRNLLAQQIKQTARWQGIPMVENPPLAHALYRTVEVGQYIPPKLYAVVAAILAAIYRAEQRTRGAASASNQGVNLG